MNKKRSKHSITVGNTKYNYFISFHEDEDGYDTVFFECKAAKIAQPFLREDIPALLIDLPELILEEKEYQKKQKDIIRFRVSVDEKKKIERKAVKKGYASVSSFLRDLALKA